MTEGTTSESEIARLQDALDERDGRLRWASVELARLRQVLDGKEDSASRWYVLDTLAEAADLTPSRLRDILTSHIAPSPNDVDQMRRAFSAMPSARLAILASEIARTPTTLDARLSDIGVDTSKTLMPR